MQMGVVSCSDGLLIKCGSVFQIGGEGFEVRAFESAYEDTVATYQVAHHFSSKESKSRVVYKVPEPLVTAAYLAWMTPAKPASSVTGNDARQSEVPTQFEKYLAAHGYDAQCASGKASNTSKKGSDNAANATEEVGNGVVVRYGGTTFKVGGYEYTVGRLKDGALEPEYQIPRCYEIGCYVASDDVSGHVITYDIPEDILLTLLVGKIEAIMEPALSTLPRTASQDSDRASRLRATNDRVPRLCAIDAAYHACVENGVANNGNPDNVIDAAFRTLLLQEDVPRRELDFLAHLPSLFKKQVATSALPESATFPESSLQDEDADVKAARSTTLSIGVSVRLKSGGPEMTVCSLPDNNNEVLVCWFVNDEIVNKAYFRVDALRPA